MAGTDDDLDDWGELTPREVGRAFRLLSQAMPGKVPGAKGPKDAPDPFRGCISCMLSAQSRDENTAAATQALFRLASKPPRRFGLPVSTTTRRAASVNSAVR